MNFTRGKKRRPPSVIIVSLIDVLLVVLIFLMVTTTFKSLEPALQLALPKSSEATMGSSQKESFLIQVSTNFPYLFRDNQPINADELKDLLEAAVGEDPNLKVSIKADKAAPFGEVIKVIDAAKSANAGSIEAVTEKQE
jgi:biopolymer transport protein ExbD